MDLSQKRIAQIVLVSLLLAGCLMVLLPFLAAILFAAVICIVTWPIYAWLRDKLRKRDGLSAFAMTMNSSASFALVIQSFWPVSS